MYAVIKTGGKQHKVAEGEILKVEKLKASEGEPVDITDVLLIEKDGEVTLGSPFIEGAKVTAKILRHGKEDKVTIIKMKRRKDYRKKQGHRQNYSEIQIEQISV
ncbi:50S ribosomal protein L21 [SAR86 cluster bacterium]|jgi:large subunit ribosomal protein L21|nr:50S ribosomal protein L21 [Gammaproteobacteria bacterium]MDA9705457.1 50S ribosomal protein L21 [SAR86 cluster bacterium]MEC7197746.1 50S ribosomal protein L21 [Pseudomonadota bacterium]MDA9730255.1 50S ribosomal protein L21 [SAR86 cluster bacterium]MDC2993925.1 50S ribosomal protein L21 [SAR86 cluster bacterium]|tara:strand:- start:894 stop:1205 length:312 start_codon:yes stop_codon:yes gene_type:complete